MKFSFGFFAKNKSVLGVDIGTTSIKAVEIKKGVNKPKLDNYAYLEINSYLERENSALQTSSLQLYDKEVAEYLKLVIKKAGFKSRKAIGSIPTFSAFTTLIDVPQMSPEETKQTLPFKARQYIPLPADSVAIDWIKVGEKKDQEGNKVQQIFLVAVPNDKVRQYQNIFHLAGLELVSLEVDGFSLARILTKHHSHPQLIIDIGSRSTTFLIAQKGNLQFISQSDFAGSSLTQSIASGLGISKYRAEDLKKQKGLSELEYGPDYELSTLMLPVLDVIISEAKRANKNYKDKYGREAARVILAGGGANLAGIERYFEKELSLPVVKADPLSEVEYLPQLEPIAGILGPSLAVALGLGIKPFQ